MFFARNFYAGKCFDCKKKRAENFSTGKNSGFSTFAPKIFGPANFRPEFFWNFQLSSRKKFPENPIRLEPGAVGLRREVCQLPN
jgi:hypothetical protein